MTESRTLLRAAIDRSGYSARAFATQVLAVDERTVRRWLDAERGIPGTVLVVATAIAKRPALAKELARAVLALADSPAPHVA